MSILLTLLSELSIALKICTNFIEGWSSIWLVSLYETTTLWINKCFMKHAVHVNFIYTYVEYYTIYFQLPLFFFCLNIFQNDCHCSIYAIFSSSLFYVAIKTTFSQSIKCSWVPWILKISLLEFQTSTHHFHVLHVYCTNLHIFHLFCNILIKHHFVYPLLFLI